MKFILITLGAKSKETTLQEVIETHKPTVICLAETHLEENDMVEFGGYGKPFRNDRDKDGGGVLIAVQRDLYKSTMEVSSKSEEDETLWIKIHNFDKTI